eukprot:TRINITY_DN5544_c0_g1_i2.p1 TRINITY_DN5544_c0_g1~~TRINITY_DN5544_c0_g1_i2.p1  ORF type:complete len:382 (+),score=125.29 TRINITY_DN5544_c0_g1_i2:24-1148(+)
MEENFSIQIYNPLLDNEDEYNDHNNNNNEEEYIEEEEEEDKCSKFHENLYISVGAYEDTRENLIEVYNGEFDDEYKYHGKGEIIYPLNDFKYSYEGELKYGLRNGFGTLRWANNKATYIGNWVDDKINGIGTLMWGNGIIYEGEWENNHFCGSGELKWPTGKRYAGAWKNSKYSGFGCLFYNENDCRKRLFFKGKWKNGKRHGFGIMKWCNGASYEGDWYNGKRHGNGTHVFPSGQLYIGKWKNGKRHGRGVRKFTNNDRYDGVWKNDKREGIGYFIMNYGRIIKQVHKKGVLVGDTFQEPQSLQVLCIEAISRSVIKDKKLLIDLEEFFSDNDQYVLICQCVKALTTKNSNIYGNNNNESTSWLLNSLVRAFR